jgi:hypothetical protein
VQGQWGTPELGQKKDVYLVNNTVYSNGTHGIWINSTNVVNIVVRNNTVSNNADNPQITQLAGSEGQTTVDHNLFYSSNTTVGSSPVTGDPKFVNPGTDFHLQAGSPAIGAGSATNAPPDDLDLVARGASIDIGAYER